MQAGMKDIVAEVLEELIMDMHKAEAKGMDEPISEEMPSEEVVEEKMDGMPVMEESSDDSGDQEIDMDEMKEFFQNKRKMMPGKSMTILAASTAKPMAKPSKKKMTYG